MLLNELTATIIAIDPVPELPEYRLITARLDSGQLISAQASLAVVGQASFQVGKSAVYTFPVADVTVGLKSSLVPWPEPVVNSQEIRTDFVDPLGNQWAIRVRARATPEALATFLHTTQLALRAEPISQATLATSSSIARSLEPRDDPQSEALLNAEPDIILSLQLRPVVGKLVKKQFVLHRAAVDNGGGIDNSLIQMEHFADVDGDATLRFTYQVDPFPKGIQVAYNNVATGELVGSGNSTLKVDAREGLVRVAHTPGTIDYTLQGEVAGTIA
jgi:hypothetical protein